ncbi:universal stress protein [Rubrivirga sp.]|uniref:universal stress protein n=1 Tax=Rubrivirga sp. TaxID=1885344 RepID=UPI003C78D2A0
MYRYKDIIVGLGLDGYDDSVVDYAALVASMAQSDRVRFTHVLPSPSSLGDLYPIYRQSFEDARVEARRRIEDVVEDHFDAPDSTAVSRMLLEGSPLLEILRLASDGADLVVVCRDHDGGTIAEKLARKAPCSVLVVPPDVPPAIRRIVVPVDFSDHAADAVEVAAAFAESAGLEEVHLLHVYPIPTSYFKLDLNHDEFERQVRLHAEDRFERFVARLDLHGLRSVRHLAGSDDVPDAIRRETAALEADLVMVGTRGRTDTAAVLLGSVAEQLVRTADVPTVAVKRKGSTLGLLDALFHL